MHEAELAVVERRRPTGLIPGVAALVLPLHGPPLLVVGMVVTFVGALIGVWIGDWRVAATGAVVLCSGIILALLEWAKDIRAREMDSRTDSQR